MFRELQRLDSISKSPIYALFSETMAGLGTVRAYQQEDRFLELMQRNVDINTRVFLWLNTANRWLGVRLVSVVGLGIEDVVWCIIIISTY